MLLHVSLLGRFDCRAGTDETLVFPTRKVRALFAYLAAEPDRRHGRDRLAGLLWGGKPDAQARANLRKTLSRLRGSLPDTAKDCLTAEAETIAVRAAGLTVDVVQFQTLAADGTPASLEQAAALYRGELLEGFGDCGAAFGDWRDAECRRLNETYRDVLQRLLDHHLVTGGIDRAIHVALRLLTLDPLQESVHRHLMRLYYYQDRMGAALDQYAQCRDLLACELGVEPSAETERMKAALLKSVPGDTVPPLETDRVPAAVAAAAGKQPGRSGRPSIAVVGFAADGPADETDHIGNGVAEDIATELGRFRELDVIAPATTLAYRNAPVPPERVGADLGADYVLAGGLRPRGDGLRITVRLVETETGRQVWAERYDGARAEIFEMQDDVVRRVAGSLPAHIEQAEIDGLGRRDRRDWQAYELCLRGWSALRRPGPEAIREAREHFQRAIKQDPDFARAHIGLAMAHINDWACFSWNYWAFIPEPAMDLARRAVELDARDQRAHCILAVAKLYGRDYDAARRHMLRAMALNPNDADVLAHAGFALALIGDTDKAVEASRDALRLAPYRPEWYGTFAGIGLFSARLYEEAIEAMAAAPQAVCNTPAFIAAAYAHLGEPEQGAAYRDTVHRHLRYQVARGSFPEGTKCIDWLTALDPYRREADAAHYVEGLRKAGFE